MSDKLWKATERKIAELLGAERVPITGRKGVDCSHFWLAIEVKERKEYPGWLHEATGQAVKSARGDQLPIAVLHQKGQRHDNDFIVMRMSDFRDWFNGKTKTFL